MDMPNDVLLALQYEIGRHGLECADNYRAYRRKDAFGYDEFVSLRKRGCCGSMETSIIDSVGDEWMVGCNHGH